MSVARELRGAFTALALIAVLLLVACSINLGLPGQPLLQSLRFHIAALMLVVMAGIALCGGRRRLYLFGSVLILSVAHTAFIVIGQHAARGDLVSQPATAAFRLLSFNVLDKNVAGAPAIAEYILGSGADVVVTFESNPLFAQLQRLATGYPYRFGCDDAQNCDALILSKTPLTDAHVLTLGELWVKRSARAVVTVDGQAVTVVATHLIKPYFDGSAEREVNGLIKLLSSLPGPVVVAGDFNAAPWSDNVARLVSEAGLLPAPTHPPTWPVELGPLAVPIDNVFSRAPLLITSIQSTPPLGSNHRGLMTELAFVTPKP